MPEKITGNNKHLTLDDRIAIEKGLDKSDSIRSIAIETGKPLRPSPERSAAAAFLSSIDRVLSGERQPTFALECDQTTVAYKMALSGVGAALLSPVALYNHLGELTDNPEIVAFPLQDQPLENAVYLVYRSDVPPAQHILSFIEKAIEVLPGYIETVRATLG